MKVFITVLFVCVLCLIIEGCEDKHNKCKLYAKNGKCNRKRNNWKNWMAKRCQLSCGCPKDNWCVDRKPKACKKYKKKYCGTNKKVWKKWMNKNCRKTCGCQPFKECGIQKHKEVKKSLTFSTGVDERIVGGKNALRGQVPWQVGIWYTEEVLKINRLLSLDKPFCGGSLIAPNVVVSAAHCFLTDPDTGTDAKNYYVIVGDLNVKTDENHQMKVDVKRVITHKEFNKATYFNDIALLILKEDVAFSDAVTPICIPEKHTFPLPEACSVSGWGLLEEDGNQATHLQVVQLPPVPVKICNPAYKKIYKNQKPPVISDKMVCAGYDVGEKDSCRGDSGGPMSCPKIIKGKKRFYLSGIVSYGHGCARAKSYGVYTNAYSYINWIRQKLEYELF